MKTYLRITKVIAGGGLLLLLFFLLLPVIEFEDPYATLLHSDEGQLLAAKLATDEQWRFPPSHDFSHKFYEAVIQFEDQRFENHFGVDPLALARALKQNTVQGEVKSGASTLSMQVVRLSLKKPRTIWYKAIESLLAMRLEWRYSKKEIFALWATHAPFGGNVVGIDAACWRYFHKSPRTLSWAEAATLAVLPNAPALIHPGKGQKSLLKKRNFLLKKLHNAGRLDSLSYQLALLEKIPPKPIPLPQHNPHLLQQMIEKFGEGQRFQSHQSFALHQQALPKINQWMKFEKEQGIHNASLLLTENKTGKVLLSIGNLPPTFNTPEHWVNMLESRRSPGSTLKPFLYAASLDEGIIPPKGLIDDFPIVYTGFSPENFDKQWQGVVPADKALQQSLNLPFVALLDQFTYPKFHHLLKNTGFTTLDHSPDHYGLSLILGGAEVTQIDLHRAYQNLAQKLARLAESNLHWAQIDSITQEQSPTPYTLGSLWHLTESLKNLKRPGIDGQWKIFSSQYPVAWKTGTSMGFRDAWAVGYNPEYTLSVWVGNADGEGRPNLTGIKSAAPLFFRIWNALDHTQQWFEKPKSDLVEMEMCVPSGWPATPDCPQKEPFSFPLGSQKLSVDPYLKQAMVNQKGERISRDCENELAQELKTFFYLEPSKAHFFFKKHPQYRHWPQSAKSCGKGSSFSLFYPRENAKIRLPKTVHGHLGELILKAHVQNKRTTLFWYLNNQSLGTTKDIHEKSLKLDAGDYTLTLVNPEGVRLTRRFEVLGP